MLGVSQFTKLKKGHYPKNPVLFAVTGTSRVWLVGKPLGQKEEVDHPYFWWAVQFFTDEKCTTPHPSTASPVEFQHRGVWIPRPVKEDPASCPTRNVNAGGV